MSAVSNSVMPASSAAWTRFRVAARSSRMPTLLQPRPTAETCSPVVPKLRCSMPSGFRFEDAVRIAAEDHVAIRCRDRKLLDARHAIEIAHVERIVAAKQHVLDADRGDHEFERVLGMEDGVVEQPSDRRLGRLLEIGLRFWTHLEAVTQASGLVGQKAAAVREAGL